METNYVIINDFRLKDCQWMTTENLKICRYEDGKEVGHA